MIKMLISRAVRAIKDINIKVKLKTEIQFQVYNDY